MSPDAEPGVLEVASPGPGDAARESTEVRLRHSLETARRDLPGAVAVIADKNGLPIASAGRPAETRGATDLATTAMATLSLATARRMTSSLHLPEPQYLLVAAGDFIVIVQALGASLSLCTVLPATTNLGFARIVLERVGQEVRDILREFAAR